MKSLKNKLIAILVALAMVVVLAACGAKSTTTDAESGQSSGVEVTEESTPKSTNTDLFTDRDFDPSYENATTIDLSKESASKVTITEAGTYVLTGTYNGQVVVNVDDTDKVQLVLDNVTIANSDSAAIYVRSGDKVFVTLKKGTSNKLSSSASFASADEETGDKVDAAIWSKATLTFNGTGKLSVTCDNGHGIVSKDDLKVTGGTLTVSAGKKALQGKDSVRIGGGTLSLDAGTEGIESKEVYVVDGVLSITAKDDGINASDSDSTADLRDTQSALLEIRGGTLHVNAQGDALDSNGTLKVTGGTTYVSGPTNGGNGAIDCDNASISGGTVIAAGSAGMAMNFGSDSTQCSMLVSFDSTVKGGTEVTLKDSSGKTILSYTPEKDYQTVVLSSGDIRTGETYTVTAGSASATVEMTDTIYGTGNPMGGMGGMQGGPAGRQGGGPGGPRGGFDGQQGNMSEGEMPDAQSSATM